jgi:hypothetical protein
LTALNAFVGSNRAVMVDPRGESGFKETVVALIAPARSFLATILRCATPQLGVNYQQYRAKPLVVGNRPLIDLLRVHERS